MKRHRTKTWNNHDHDCFFFLGKTKRWCHFGPVKQIQYPNISQITKEAKFTKKQKDIDKEKQLYFFNFACA